jgi:hypothetical protein
MGRFLAGDESGEVPGVGSDVADGTARTGLLGVGAPHRALGAGVFHRRGQPVLQVLHLDAAELADLASGNHPAPVAPSG